MPGPSDNRADARPAPVPRTPPFRNPRLGLRAGFVLSVALAAACVARSPGFAGGLPGSEGRQDLPPVHIPADRRHQGVSRFDLFPFTDRPKGDPDRYRAVNPNHVRKEGAYYYYLLDAVPGMHHFDEGLNDRGALTEKKVAADFGRTKEAKGGDGKTVRYVFVRDHGYVRRDALTPAAEIRTGKWFQFPLKPGSHSLFDGTGILRGTVVARAVRLNYGQQKQINGERCLYAFSTSIRPEGSQERQGASGWVRASALQNGNDPQYSEEVVTKMQPPTVAESGRAFAAYEVTGGDPREKTGVDAAGKPIYRFGYADDAGRFISYKVLPGVTVDANMAATDYLKRNDAVINLGFNAAGVSNDTYRVSGAGRPLTFRRAPDGDATAAIDLFHPRDATQDGTQIVAKMTFVYGYVEEGAGAKRWGWMPLDALRPRAP